MSEYFKGKSPCSSCPYRRDAKLQLWDKLHFDELIIADKKQFGACYKCHKNNGSACKGWLLNQWKRGLPNLNLRLTLMKHNPPANYMRSLRSRVPMFESVEEMCEANYQGIMK